MADIQTDIPLPQERPRHSRALRELRASDVGSSVLLVGISRTYVYLIARSILGAGNYRVAAEGDGYRVWMTGRKD